MVSFRKDYPELFQFFAGYFPDADIDGITDEDVVASYVIDCNKSEKSKVELEKSKKELISLMREVKFYWQEISQESNKYFSNCTDALEWLTKIHQQLQK